MAVSDCDVFLSLSGSQNRGAFPLPRCHPFPTARGGMPNDERQEKKEDDDTEMIRFDYERFIDENDPEKGKEKVSEEWSVGHARLCYMVSKYAKCALSLTDQESWIRQLPSML